MLSLVSKRIKNKLSQVNHLTMHPRLTQPGHMSGEHNIMGNGHCRRTSSELCTIVGRLLALLTNSSGHQLSQPYSQHGSYASLISFNTLWLKVHYKKDQLLVMSYYASHLAICANFSFFSHNTIHVKNENL